MSAPPVLCLPFAGAGASFYRPWRKLARTAEIIPVQLPGREERLAEEPYTSVAEAVDELAPEAAEVSREGNGIVIFGHSLGAVLAYELARRLDGEPGTRLVVSGSPGPFTRRERRATGLGDEEFLARVRDIAGYDHAALADAEMREILLPVLRADLAMHEDYVAEPGPPLSMPVTAVRGRDDTLVSATQVDEWRATTTGPFDAVELPGGHMYLVDEAEPLLAVLEGERP
jgi:surfactin synthase thioesterase subunit